MASFDAAMLPLRSDVFSANISPFWRTVILAAMPLRYFAHCDTMILIPRLQATLAPAIRDGNRHRAEAIVAAWRKMKANADPKVEPLHFGEVYLTHVFSKATRLPATASKCDGDGKSPWRMSGGCVRTYRNTPSNRRFCRPPITVVG
jgi:hypothetical protein